MNAPRSAAMSMIDFCEISQTVLYRFLMSSGISKLSFPSNPLKNPTQVGMCTPFKSTAPALPSRWMGSPLPCLGGLSPKEAAMDQEGRELLDALLLSLEHGRDSERSPKPDIGKIKSQLGYDGEVRQSGDPRDILCGRAVSEVFLE